MAFAKFTGYDFYDMDSLLSDEEKMARQTVREFVEQEVLPIIEKHYEAGTYPHHLTAKMAELGLFGANLPEKYGCAGLNNVAYGLIMQELERGDSGLRSLRLGAGRAGACTRSTPTAPRSRRTAGCRDWPPARPSAASASPSPTSAPIRAA